MHPAISGKLRKLYEGTTPLFGQSRGKSSLQMDDPLETMKLIYNRRRAFYSLIDHTIMEEEYVPLFGEEREILLGSLLGDGSLKIHKGYRNARFSFRHSVIQKSYFLWKASKLQFLGSSKTIFFQENDGGYGRNGKLRFQSRALPSLTDIYLLTHKSGKFCVRRKWLNQMTALSLSLIHI